MTKISEMITETPQTGAVAEMSQPDGAGGYYTSRFEVLSIGGGGSSESVGDIVFDLKSVERDSTFVNLDGSIYAYMNYPDYREVFVPLNNFNDNDFTFNDLTVKTGSAKYQFADTSPGGENFWLIQDSNNEVKKYDFFDDFTFSEVDFFAPTTTSGTFNYILSVNYLSDTEFLIGFSTSDGTDQMLYLVDDTGFTLESAGSLTSNNFGQLQSVHVSESGYVIAYTESSVVTLSIDTLSVLESTAKNADDSGVKAQFDGRFLLGIPNTNFTNNCIVYEISSDGAIFSREYLFEQTENMSFCCLVDGKIAIADPINSVVRFSNVPFREGNLLTIMESDSEFEVTANNPGDSTFFIDKTQRYLNIKADGQVSTIDLYQKKNVYDGDTTPLNFFDFSSTPVVSKCGRYMIDCSSDGTVFSLIHPAAEGSEIDFFRTPVYPTGSKNIVARLKAKN